MKTTICAILSVSFLIFLNGGSLLADTMGIAYAPGNATAGIGTRTDTGTYGSFFIVGSSPITVSALGVQDVTALNGSDSSTQIASPGTQVGIWGWNGSAATLLAWANVTSSDALQTGAGGDYVFDSGLYTAASYSVGATSGTPLGSPLSLSAGDYLIGAAVGTASGGSQVTGNSGAENWLLAGNASPGQNLLYVSNNSDVTLSGSVFFNGQSVPYNGTLGLVAPIGNISGFGNGSGWGPANFLIAAPAAVPEPSTVTLLLLAALSGLTFGAAVRPMRAQRVRRAVAVS